MANVSRFFVTSKGNEAVELNGFEYRFAKRVDTGDHKYWRCIKRLCPGSVKTDVDNTNLVSCNVNHNHVANFEATSVCLVVQAMRERAENELMPLPQIYKDEVGQLAGNLAAAAQMPTYLHIQSGHLECLQCRCSAEIK